MSDERLKQLEAAAWREWEESWGNTESGAHYSGFTAGYRVAEADHQLEAYCLPATTCAMAHPCHRAGCTLRPDQHPGWAL